MALISIKRNVDLQPGLNAPAVFNCSQSDKGTTIMLGLMNGGNDYTVPSGVTITIRGSRSNGAVFAPTSATFSGSTVSFTLTEEMTDTAGPTLCEAVLEQGNNVLGTANFIINVEGSPMGADVPPVFTDAAWTWMLGKLTTETVPALGDDVISSIQGKVDKSQGSTNAKKFLRVNTSGNVSLASTDKTLSVADQIADAKETGDQIRALDAEIDGVVTTLGGSISTLNGITTGLQSSKLNKNQGTSNAGKTMVVDSSGNIVPGDALALKANESTIAPEFSTSDSYTAGQYVYKNGVLYKFTADHTAGAWTGTDVEVVTVGKELTDLKANLKIPENIGGNSVGNLAIDYRTGEANGSANQTHTDYVDLTGVQSIVYTRITTTSTSSYTGMAFYDANKVYISGQRCVVGASKYGYEVTELNVPSTAKYARFSISKDLDGFFVNTKEAYENSLSNRVCKLESDFESISSDVSGLQADISGLDIVNMDNITWELGFALTATGYTSTAANSAVSPFLPVKNEVYTRSGSATDAEENSYSLWFHQYAGNDPSTWISRTSVSVGDSITLNESCKYFRIGYVKIKGSARPAITTEDIENTFGLCYETTMQSIAERIDVLENYHPSYTGKKLSILGDSISTFVASSEKVDGKAPEGCITNYPGNVVQYQNSDVTSVNSTWWGQVIEQFGMILGINESWAGSCIGYNSSQTSSGKYTADNCLCSQARIGHLGENGTPDIIIVFGGTNDINHHRVGATDTMRYAVGELDSEHNPYDYDNFPMITETYYGSITTMLLRIQHTYPNAVILMLLPYFCTSTHTSSGDRATPYDQNEWSKAAIDVCKYLGVEYLDLRTIINLYDVSSLLFDGLHPKANGMALIAKAVIHKLNNML